MKSLKIFLPPEPTKPDSSLPQSHRGGFGGHGNENWEFDEHKLMRLRIASINDLPIKESERKYHWRLGRRPTIRG